ncbi:hypothetical protein HU200_055980 [Digitaria exilis]|uniref:Uncharacterized protein n=1 Tax=Digitaria exilis TaxID=1010633 RepID=A0A835E2K2_9POAL|nr:hypothetical protein HU200_055980 [Digitaria exilis]
MASASTSPSLSGQLLLQESSPRMAACWTAHGGALPSLLRWQHQHGATTVVAGKFMPRRGRCKWQLEGQRRLANHCRKAVVVAAGRFILLRRGRSWQWEDQHRLISRWRKAEVEKFLPLLLLRRLQ